MFVSGFTFIRNAVKFDYPIREAILSLLPLVDELIVLVGNSDDGTRSIIEEINSPKLKIHDSVWDDSIREGGRVLAVETQKAKNLVNPKADWLICIQADECFHQEDYPAINKAMQDNLGNSKVDGLLFSYTHFYGDYSLVASGRKWYKNEIRIIRNNPDIIPYKDSQGFRFKNGQKLKVKRANARVHHYSWVKSPDKQQDKQKYFHTLWHNDEWVKKHVGNQSEFDYSKIDVLEIFQGTHPDVYKKRVEEYTVPSGLKPGVHIKQWHKKVLYYIEKVLGKKIGENKNYILLK
ncbi:MAG: glycosyltransferase family 2 protein [Bacteroidia bacterium]|nr:glycosyltransferase family 2 protein [Bacteroidia bacterium]